MYNNVNMLYVCVRANDNDWCNSRYCTYILDLLKRMNLNAVLRKVAPIHPVNAVLWEVAPIHPVNTVLQEVTHIHPVNTVLREVAPIHPVNAVL